MSIMSDPLSSSPTPSPKSQQDDEGTPPRSYHEVYRASSIAKECCFLAIGKRRNMQVESTLTSTDSIMRVAYTALRERKEVGLLLNGRRRISSSAFNVNFNCLTDGDALPHSRFCKRDIIRMISAVAWLLQKIITKGNRFSVTPLLATCFTLRRLASPARWKDLDILFGKHASQLSDIYLGGAGAYVGSKTRPHKRTDKPTSHKSKCGTVCQGFSWQVPSPH